MLSHNDLRKREEKPRPCNSTTTAGRLPRATLAAGASPVTEGTAATFTARLSRPAPSAGVTVNYSKWWSRSGAFWDPDDPYAGGTSVLVPANATSATITIPTHDDEIDEPDGYVVLVLENGRHYRLPWKASGEGEARVIVTDNDGSGAPPTGGREPVGPAALTGLTVVPVAGEPTRLAVSWDAVDGAARYDVRWKTGAGDYGDAVEARTNSHTVIGLSAGTTYTVNVAAIDGGNTLLAEGTASGATAAATGNADPEPEEPAQFAIYHDPNHSVAAVGRYDTAVGLLNAAGRSYTVRTVTGTGEVDRLAGVTDSVMPRFFLGAPAAPGWGPSQPRVNNGGLRWLRSMLGSSQTSLAPEATRTLWARPSDEVAAVFEKAVLEAGGLVAGQSPVLVDMSMLFDMADPMTVDYTVSSSDPGVLAVHTATDSTLAGPALRLAPMRAGEATVTGHGRGGRRAHGGRQRSRVHVHGGVRPGRPHGLGLRGSGPAARRPARAGGPDGHRRVPPVPPAVT